MKFLIVLTALVASCVARPGYLAGGAARFAAPVVAAAPAVVAAPAVAAAPVVAGVAAPVAYSTVVAPAVETEQHHAQDTLGQYRYGYSDNLSTKGEFRTANGVTQGAYAYVDANGEVQNVAYTADAAGFRVSASNLPEAPAVPDAPELQGPEPVQDTAEVSAARAAHQVAVNIAEARAAAAAPAVLAAAPARAAIVAAAPAPARSAIVASAAPAVAAAPAVVAAAPARAAFVAAAAPAVSIASAVPSRAFAYNSVAAAPLVSAPAPYVGPQHIPSITAAGVPVDTPEVQAARAADVVAHLNAKASIFG